MKVCEVKPAPGFDYSKVRGKIKEVFGTQAAFAEALRMSPVSLSEKLNNKVQFTQKEIQTAVELLKLPKEDIPVYFFNKGERQKID